jgi:hypothetical protein
MFCAAVRPSAMMALGRIRLIWASRKGRQAAASSGAGSRFCGGRHLTTFAI